MKVYEAITKVTKALSAQGIAKGKKNAQQGYRFRGIDDVYNALSDKLAEAGLCILPRVLSRECTERTTARGGVLFYVTVEVEFDFVAAEDGSKHTIKTFGEAMDSADKATNKAMSAAYKYACMQAFCIPTEGDNDADATTHDVQGSGTKGHKTWVNGHTSNNEPTPFDEPQPKRKGFFDRESYQIGVAQEISDRSFAEYLTKLINESPDLNAIRKIQEDNMDRIHRMEQDNKGLHGLIMTAVNSRTSFLSQEPPKEAA